MRAISIACGVALAAVLLLGAMLLIVTGKGLIFPGGAGGPLFSVWIARASVVCLVSLAAVVGVWAAAHVYPRRYFQLMWWRDLALAITAISAVAVVAAVVAGQVLYGSL